MAASMATRPTGWLQWIFAATILINSIDKSAAFSSGSRACFASSSLHGKGRVAVVLGTRQSFHSGRRSHSLRVGELGRTRIGLASQDDSEVDSALASSSLSSLSTPLDRPLLAIVDAVALLVFAGIGKASHGTNDADGSGVASALQTVGTALPFLMAWFATSPITGVYKVRERTSDQNNNLIRDTALQTAPGWALAIPLGCVLRGLIRGYAPPLPFVVVAMVATLVLLCAGRVAFSVFEDFFVELV